MMRQWSIRRRMLVVAIVPALLAVLLLTSYHLWVRWADVQQEQHNVAQLLLETLGSAAEYPILSGNPQLLKPLMQSALAQRGMIAIELHAMDGTLLVAAGVEHVASQDHQQLQRLHYQIDRQVIVATSVFENDLALDTLYAPSPTLMQPQPLARLTLTVSAAANQARSQQIAQQAMMTALVVIVFSAVIGSLAARSIIPALERLTDFIAALAAGDVNVRTPVSDGAEIGRLQANANRLAFSLQQARLNQARHNEQLQSEQRKTMLASRAKSEFLAMMSHELRTPLNGAMGAIQLLELRNQPDEFAEYKEIADHSLQHLTQILEDVLVVADTEKNTVLINGDGQYLPDVLMLAMTPYAELAEHKGLLLRVQYSDVVLRQPMWLDPSLLRQLIRYLLDDAIRVSHQGRIDMEWDIRRVTDEYFQLQLMVRDQGEAVSDENNQRILTALARHHSHYPSSDGAETTRMGLEMAHHICQIVGGEVALHTHPQGGLRVVISIPIRLA